jgi:hypothetical protein
MRRHLFNWCAAVIHCTNIVCPSANFYRFNFKEGEGGGDAEVDDNADAQSEAEDEDTKNAKEAAHRSSQSLATENEPPVDIPTEV